MSENKVKSPSLCNDPNPEVFSLLPHFQSLKDLRNMEPKKPKDHTFSDIASGKGKDSDKP